MNQAAGCTIIDTIPAFYEFWRQAVDLPIDDQIEKWISSYMTQWPELLAMQTQQYESEGTDWRQVAREHIFPRMGERIHDIRLAHKNLLVNCEPLHRVAKQQFSLDRPVFFILYVGIGLGAGWATLYRGSSSVLFGLENIAEEGWTRSTEIRGLIAHEIGHLAQVHWREKAGKSFGSGPWWDLYTEGFAMSCEQKIIGENNWHMAGVSSDRDWLDWCQANRRWLAAEYLKRATSGGDLRPFFGSWHDLNGRKQTGYYLGRELIVALESQLTFREVAEITDPEEQVRRLVVEMAESEI